MAAIYDDPNFFKAYSPMDRSKKGLAGAGEWHELKAVLPDFNGKRVLDLGCGYGWHCRYAADHGAKSVLGIDTSAKMLAKATELTNDKLITYRQLDMQDIDQLPGKFDFILSSLAIHYIDDYAGLVGKISDKLPVGGRFVMSVEHPIFTAQGDEEWVTDDQGHNLYWPVDRYFDERKRETDFLGHRIKKHHRTLMTYLNTLIDHCLRLDSVIEPTPTPKMVKTIPGMADELRRPMMLIVATTKTA
ncbi:class I SAM-dependent methyltransferase [Lacticaseibacillus chiayiensis]|uniref:class I SAM-dependent methyltransferase n=1 Tax=Lacticaseibacillus chiayiensis TaxID=2100821 RepID=UPI0010131EC0|nr:class I SAM-dependent methyltransferase [Lacticaseibacillus chiayiensis]RXT56782.1 SAM-dependent methyltransferase [Lacticaseibacillus chiayiensis]